jgi:hypothetical protein
MIVSGLLAFVLVAAVTADRRQTVDIAVARDDIASGMVLRPGLFERAELAADSPLAAGLIQFDDLGDEDLVLAKPVTAGDALRRSDLRTRTETGGLRSVSIPVARAHAVGGAINVGDLIDVIDVVDGSARYVVTAAEVAAVADESARGGITAGAPQDFYVVVLVDAPGALAIAEALADGGLEVVLSTDATPIPAGAGEAEGEGDGG